MNVRTLTRLTNVGLLMGVGMGTGHLLMPTRATTGPIGRVLFLASVVGTGALAGWRERRARELDGDDNVPGAEWRWVVGGAVTALSLAWIAYEVVHG